MPKKNSEILEKLTRDLKEAVKAGREAAAEIDDWGSCNLDHLFLFTDYQFRKSAQVEKAIAAAGCHAVRVSHTRTMWKGYAVHFGTGGQAAKNWKAVGVACGRLKTLGWNRFGIFYQTD